MIDILDVHTHTIASGHAYSTLQEMIDSAKTKGLKLLGITEHTNKITWNLFWNIFLQF